MNNTMKNRLLLLLSFALIWIGCEKLPDPDPQYVIGMDVTLKARDQGDIPGVEYTIGKEEDILRGDELIIKNVTIYGYNVKKVPFSF